jgi:hypothetical protein
MLPPHYPDKSSAHDVLRIHNLINEAEGRMLDVVIIYGYQGQEYPLRGYLTERNGSFFIEEIADNSSLYHAYADGSFAHEYSYTRKWRLHP